MTKKNAVSYICNAGCNSCFACERKCWSKSIIKSADLRQCGTDSECPLMQFDAAELDIKDFRKMNIIPTDLDKICLSCKHFTTDENGYITGDAYTMHCLDCPCNMMRDCMAEAEAEARCS